MKMIYKAPELMQFTVVPEAGFALSAGWETQLPEYGEETLPEY